MRQGHPNNIFDIYKCKERQRKKEVNEKTFDMVIELTWGAEDQRRESVKILLMCMIQLDFKIGEDFIAPVVWAQLETLWLIVGSHCLVLGI